jgi:hypothetical protein
MHPDRMRGAARRGRMQTDSAHSEQHKGITLPPRLRNVTSKRARRFLQGARPEKHPMRKQAILVAAATVVVGIGVALAENQAPQQYDKSAAASGLQSTTPDHPPIVTLPEANAPAPDATGASILETTGE